MKKLIAIIATVIIPFAVFSQHLTNDTISNLELMLNQKGTMLKKEYGGIIRSKSATIKSPGSCNYETIIVTDLKSGATTGGLRIKAFYVYTFANSTKTEEYIAYLDPDEITSCVQFLKKMSDEYMNSTPEQYTELVYKTSDGFSIGGFYDPKDKNPIWKVFIKTKNYTDRSFVSIDKDDIPVIIEDFENACKSIKSKTGK